MLPDSTPNTPPFEPIAIIGLAVRGPGGIDNLDSLWDTLVERKSHCFPLAKDPRFHRRFNPDDWKALFDGIPDSENLLHSNLFEETPGLDRKYFSLSEREAAGMDVQQKLLLHVAHEALEDAGYSGTEDNSAFNPNTFGVYIATATDEVIQDPRDYDTDIYHLVRTERAFLSGQICYHFGLRGPSSSVDTVCSGSITAFNDACRALATGECNAAIAGGVHVVTPVSGPISFYSIKRAGFLDRTGQCKPFLQNGTGYSRSEGCGLVVMKRLSDALREGDRIHGVIRGLCIRSMASPKFISQPDGGYQSIALARAVEISGVDPAAISYSEAHGPGTAKGDPAEVSSLCSVIAEHRDPDNVLIVGSIKGNVGHAEAASGAQSLAKVIAMFQRRRIPPQADFHTSRMNPTLRPYFDNYPMRIIEKEEDWNASPRIATVGNFGASGNAGFMVIEEGLSFLAEGRDIAKITPLPFIISAKDLPTLIKLIHRYLEWLKLPSTLSTPLSDISYAMTARRFSHSFTISFLANSHDDIAKKLQEQQPVVETAADPKPREVAFCFSGQGGERLDPHKSTLYNVSASFTDAVDICFRIAETESLIEEDDRPMLELFALEYGLVQMWKSWGINPVALAGHSFGEYVALVCAGVLSVHDALKLLGVRAALIRARCSDIQSQMAAVRLPLADITKFLEQQQSTHVELACINSDISVTLAGTPEDLELFRAELVTAYPAARWQLLNTMTAAFHSRFMQPISQEFINACKEVEFHPPKQVVLSALLGRMCPVGDNALQQGDYLVRHCRETNRFGTAVSDYQRQNTELEKSQADWLEIGSHSRIISFISLAAGQLKFPSHGKQAEQGWTTALDTFMSLFAAGHEVDFKGFHHDINPSARHTDLPLYPFELEPHFYPVRRAAKAGSAPATVVQAHPPVLAKDLAPLLRNHVICGYTLTPATTHLGLLLLAASTSPTQHEGRSAYRVTKFKVQAGFTNTTDGSVQVRTQLPSPDVEVYDHEDHLLVTGRVDKCKEQDLLDSISLYESLILPMKSIKSLPTTDVLRKEMAYSLFSHTVNYGAHGQVIDRAWIAEDGHQAWGYSAYKHDDTAKEGMPTSLYDFSPMLLEAACQLVGFLINTSADRKTGEIFVTDELGECAIAIQRLYETKYIETYASYRLVDNGNAALGQVFAFDDQGQIITAFRDVRMARMKLHVLKRLIDRILKPEQQVSTSQAVADVQEYDDANDDFDEKVISILQSALRVAELPRDKPLGDLGLDSLTAIDVGVQLERLLPRRKDHLAIDPESTVTALIQSLRPTPVAQVPQVTSETKESTVNESTVKDASVKIDEFEEKVTAVFRTSLRRADLPRDKTLRELGLDAHAAVDIMVQLRQLVPNLPAQFVIDRQCTLPSLTQILRSPPVPIPVPASVPIPTPTPTVVPSVTESGPPILDNVSQEMMEAMSSNPEVTQYAPGPTPLLLIHDGGGTAFAYHSLRSLDRTVLGIHSTGLLEGKGIVSVMHAAHEYAALGRKYLKENCPEHSKLLLGGWSLGGTISLTIAALYPDLVCGVLVIDSTPPGVSGMNVQQAEAVLLHPWTRTDGIHGLVRKQLQNNTRALMANKEHETMYRSIKVPVYILCATDPFQPPPTMSMDHLPATATTWLLSSKRPQIAEAAWKAILGDCFVGSTTIPGNHWTMFTPVNTTTTTDAMRHAIDVLEKAENDFAMF